MQSRVFYCQNIFRDGTPFLMKPLANTKASSVEATGTPGQLWYGRNSTRPRRRMDQTRRIRKLSNGRSPHRHTSVPPLCFLCCGVDQPSFGYRYRECDIFCHRSPHSLQNITLGWSVHAFAACRAQWSCRSQRCTLFERWSSQTGIRDSVWAGDCRGRINATIPWGSWCE